MSKMFRQIISILLAKDIPFTIHTIGERYALRGENEVGGVATWVLLDRAYDGINPTLNYIGKDGGFHPIEFDQIWGYIELIEGL